jgi:hypothetical protein
MSSKEKEIKQGFKIPVDMPLVLASASEKYTTKTKDTHKKAPYFFNQKVSAYTGYRNPKRKTQTAFLTAISSGIIHEGKLEVGIHEEYAHKLRFCTLAVQFIMNEIRNEYTFRSPNERSQLYTILKKEILKIDENNELDELSKKALFFKTYNPTYLEALRIAIKQNLEKQGEAPLDDEMWRKFVMYLDKESRILLGEKYHTPLVRKVCARTLQGLCSAPGFGVGYVLGMSFGESNFFGPAKNAISVTLGGIAYNFTASATGGIGVFLLTRQFTESLVNQGVAFTIANGIAWSSGALGYASGYAFGWGLEAAYYLIKYTLLTSYNLIKGEKPKEQVDGYDVLTNAIYIDGIKFELKEIDLNDPPENLQYIDFKEVKEVLDMELPKDTEEAIKKIAQQLVDETPKQSSDTTLEDEDEKVLETHQP